MNKHVMIRMAVVAMLALTLILPFGVSADTSIYVYGVIWDDARQAASSGSQIELWRDGRLAGVSEAKDAHGSWGVQVTIRGTGSTITVKLLDRDGIEGPPLVPEPLAVIYGGHNVGNVDNNEATFWVTPADLNPNGTFGPIYFKVADEAITPPEPVEPPTSMYIYGRVWDSNTGLGVDGAQVTLTRVRGGFDENGDPVGWIELIGICTTAGGGYYGFGTSPIAAEPYLVAMIGLPPPYNLVVDPPLAVYTFGPEAFAELIGPFDFEVTTAVP